MTNLGMEDEVYEPQHDVAYLDPCEEVQVGAGGE